MAYSTNAQVAAEFKDIKFTLTSAVTTDDVDRFIEEADAEINGRIGFKYATPVTGTTSLIILRKISIQLVACRIKDILKVKTGDKEVSQETKGGCGCTTDAMKALDMIAKGTLALADATLTSDSDGVRSFAVDEQLEYQFQRYTDQW